MHHVFTLFSKNLDFSISLTGKIPVSNKKLQGVTPTEFRSLTRVSLSMEKKNWTLYMLDKRFTCQWIIFLSLRGHWQVFRLSVEDIQWLTGALPVSGRGRDLTGKIPVSGTCYFLWQVFDLSMDEMVILHAADKCFTCQRRQRVTVLPPVSAWIPKSLFFCM